jgi:hypothetical protein
MCAAGCRAIRELQNRKTVRPHAVRCHTCGTRSLRSSDSPPLPALEVPVHQHRALDDAQTSLIRSPSAIAARRGSGADSDDV